MGQTLTPIRDQTRSAVRGILAQSATRLFAERGFDDTTLDDVAAAAGVSRRTLFNYFKNKEDLALSALDEQGELIARRLAEVPPDVPAWPALRAAFAVLEEFSASTPARLTLVRLLFDNESLRPGHARKQARWTDLLAPLLHTRMPAGPDLQLRSRALVGAAIVCLQTANEEWARLDAAVPLFDLYDTAVHALQT